jgi:MFS family permease
VSPRFRLRGATPAPLAHDCRGGEERRARLNRHWIAHAESQDAPLRTLDRAVHGAGGRDDRERRDPLDSRHASPSGAALELVVGGYLVAFAVLLITGARLAQAHGYKRLFTLGMVLFSLASLACGLAWSPWALVVARVVQGAGAALMFPQTLTGVQFNFSDDARAR